MMNAAWKARTEMAEANTVKGKEPREAESKTDLEIMDTTDLEANQEETDRSRDYRSTEGLIGGQRTAVGCRTH
jgi:hypothetical protein